MTDADRAPTSGPALAVGLNAVIVAVTREAPRILTVPRRRLGDAPTVEPALPFGPLDPAGDRTLELGLRRWVREQTGLALGYVEQLYTFGDRDREFAVAEGARVLSIAYLALTRERRGSPGLESGWSNVYDHLPWEDRREGTPRLVEERIEPRLVRWAEEGGRDRVPRRERIELAFGLGGVPWDADRVLERYELLYEAGLVAEAARDRRPRDRRARDRRARDRRSDPRGAEADGPFLGRAMALDHRRILATALGRLRGKIRYRPVVFELLSERFTLLRLQRVVESLAGVRLHKQNFRRLVDRNGLVEGTGRRDYRTGGRPAELFRFRREVLRERRAPGVGLPGVADRTRALG